MPFIKFRNKNIFYKLEGKGNPVMLLHGFGEDGHIWNHQVEKLKKDFLVIVPDLPGCGQSELLEGDCSLEDYAEVIKMIADSESITSKSYGTFSLIGHSMGGYITLAFAEKYGQLLNSFGLFHSSAFADNQDKIATREKGIDFIEKNGAQLYAETTVPNLFSDQTKKNHPKLVKDLVEIAGKLPAETLIQYTRAMIKRRDTTAVLQSFSKPVLFIIGIHDNAVPLEASLKQCHLSQIGCIHFLQHSGHVGMWEEKELSNQYLYSFLDYFVYSNK
ncbi:MAG: alpha/beta hydrolase [Ginsengibacter sp.]|jgi:pimeloyl-ACP methyl ester carboxylesterase